MVAARRLDTPLPPVQAIPVPQGDLRQLDDRLADLLRLLQNNNLKALAEFDALRPELADLVAPDALATLADAIATLAFAAAAQQIKDILNRKVVQ
jgi:two-component system, sensor histidine kinase and response regulator